MEQVIFCVDNQTRDLPSTVLISCHLNKRGIKTKIIPLGNEIQFLFEKKSLFIFPKVTFSLINSLLIKSYGHMIGVIEVEGNNQDKEIEYNIRVSPDYWCFWNNFEKEKYEKNVRLKNTFFTVQGCQRIDFLHSKYNYLYNQISDNKNKTITIALSSQDTHFSSEKVNFKSKRRSRKFIKSANYEKVVKNQLLLRSRVEKLIEKIINNTKCNILLKPHPNENIIYWIDYVSALKSDRISLSLNEYFNFFIIKSDLHISFNVCTTSVEARICKVPILELHTNLSNELYSDKHLDIANVKSFNEETDFIYFKSLLENNYNNIAKKNIGITDNQFELYQTNMYGNFNGENCLRICVSIIEFFNFQKVHKNRGVNRSIIKILNFIIMLRKLFSNAYKRQTIARKDADTVLYKGYEIYKNHGILVSNSFEDEIKFWYKKL